MLTLLNLLSAVALLIWGTHIVRTGILRVYGTQLRHVIGQNMSKKWLAFVAGIVVTAMVQSATPAMLVTLSSARADGADPRWRPCSAPTRYGVDGAGADLRSVVAVAAAEFCRGDFFSCRANTRLGQMGRVSIAWG